MILIGQKMFGRSYWLLLGEPGGMFAPSFEGATSAGWAGDGGWEGTESFEGEGASGGGESG